MKFLKNIVQAAVVGLLVFASVETAQAGGRGFDLFGATRNIAIVPVTQTASITGGSTNVPAFIRYFDGIAVCTFNAYTNTGTNVVTVTPQSSIDNTNWTTLTNYALVTTTAIVTTNLYYAPGTNASLTNLLATNFTLLPGTYTYPTASTAGFATPYLSPTPFTNGGAITFGAGTNTIAFAFNCADVGTYLRVNVTTVGTNVYNANLMLPLVNSGQ